MSYVIMPTAVSQPSTPRDDDAILALTSLVAPTRHGLVMNDLPDAVALAHRLRGSVTIAVAPAASVASAVPHDVYIAAVCDRRHTTQRHYPRPTQRAPVSLRRPWTHLP